MTAHETHREVAHIVSTWQYWLDRLGIKIPRARCGASLRVNPGETVEAELDSMPACPACLRKGGRQ